MARLAVLALLVACGSSSSKQAPTKITDGIQIVYSADLDAAVDHAATELARGLRAELGAMAQVRTVFVPLGGVTVRVADPARRAEADAIIKAKIGKVVAMVECEASERLVAICMRITDERAEALRMAAVGEAVAVIRKRIESGALAATVTANGTSLVVDVAGTNQDEIARTRDVIARVGRLEIKAVDHDSEYMRSVFQHVEADKATQEPRVDVRITARMDQWRGAANGELESELYLVAHDREKLQGYLEELARSDPRFVVPADRQFGYEHFDGAPREWWRTHFLVREGGVSGPPVKRATSQRDGVTRDLRIVIELEKAGAKALEELSANSVGKKIAIVLDHRIISTPLVAAPLAGRRLSIALGGPADRQQREADELVAVLRAGALPAPIREETVSELRGGKVIPPPVE
jgi:preprotein translocase subunit SecD